MEVVSGLKEGDQVIYAGYEMLKEDDPVVPTEWGPAGPLTVPPATGEEKAAPGTVYTCPMHPKVRMDKPGDCPECGMKLQPASKNPATGAASAPASGATGAAGKADYICPMDKDVHSDRPGKCPKCGMDLEPAPKATATYYCPMHPEVQSDRPGKCPRCSMDLVPKPGAAGATGSRS